ncbi:prenyltransferase [Parahaliea maris]|nr:prenyltransferase [Parahaliea maris]
MDNQFNAGLWRLADPKISITSLAAMTVGAAPVAGHPDFSWPWLAVMGLAMFCMEVAKNAWGDVYDYDSGTDLAVQPEDRTNFSGGKRVLVDELLSRRQTWGIAFGFGAVGIALGALMVLLREPGLFWLGTTGLVLGWSYHGPPLQLAYRGLGELDVVLCYGPLVALSTGMLMSHSVSSDVFWLSLPLGIFIAAFLWVNEFPDFHADRSAGKYNLVARLGKHRASRLLPVIYLAGFGLLLVYPLLGGLPKPVWLGFSALPSALLAQYWTWHEPDTFHRNRPVQPLTLLTFVLYAAGVGVGAVLGY